MLAAEQDYRPSESEPFMNDRQKEYFRQKKKAVVYEKWRSHAVQLGIPVGGNLTQAA